MRQMIMEALKAKYFGVMKEAQANIEIYLESPVGIGEHPDIIAAIDSQLAILPEAQEKFQVLEEFNNGAQ